MTINDHDRSRIGRWGEKYVYEILLKKHDLEIKRSQMKIEWINQETETGHPYDIKITNYAEDSWDTINETFIEVKSTTKPYKESKDFFQVSINELTFAISKQDNFEIYRLYNAGSRNFDNIAIKKLTNIQKNLVSHNINLLMII